MGGYGARVRPRYGRIAALVAAVVVTSVSMFGGVGLLPSSAGTPGTPAAEQALDPAALVVAGAGGEADEVEGSSDPAAAAGSRASGRVEARRGEEIALPPGSGAGRRIVFSESAQRVWLVDGDGTVRRTYLVSGSLTDNLDPGDYQVYSRSRWAVGVNDSGVMQYYVRFAHGDRSTIGFHTIPTHHGEPVQSVADLGTPQSHGCIRQRRADAIALWHFAPVGTRVVVV